MVSGAITCCPPMGCARRRTINHHRTIQDDPKDEKAMPALFTSGEEPPATQMEVQACSTLRGYDLKNLYDVVTNKLLSLPGVPRTH